MAMNDGYVRHRVYVDVLGDYLWVAEDADGELYFPVRPSCKALEIDSTTALETIKQDSRITSGLRKIRLPTDGRGEHEQQCLASTEYAWWLALIDPRRFNNARRPVLEERQRVLMRLAKDIMLRRDSVTRLSPTRTTTPPSIGVQGQIEAHFKCLKCGAPHVAVIDGAGWHLHVGVEVE